MKKRSPAGLARVPRAVGNTGPVHDQADLRRVVAITDLVERAEGIDGRGRCRGTVRAVATPSASAPRTGPPHRRHHRPTSSWTINIVACSATTSTLRTALVDASTRRRRSSTARSAINDARVERRVSSKEVYTARDAPCRPASSRRRRPSTRTARRCLYRPASQTRASPRRSRAPGRPPAAPWSVITARRRWTSDRGRSYAYARLSSTAARYRTGRAGLEARPPREDAVRSLSSVPIVVHSPSADLGLERHLGERRSRRRTPDLGAVARLAARQRLDRDRPARPGSRDRAVGAVDDPDAAARSRSAAGRRPLVAAAPSPYTG